MLSQNQIKYTVGLGMILTLLLYLWIDFVDFTPDQREIGGLTSGQTLAYKYCSACHLFPDPALLDRNSWLKNVLPEMGRRMGIQTGDYDPYQGMASEEIKIIKGLNVYPENPVLTTSEWDSIVNYYVNHSPPILAEVSHTTKVSDTPPPFQAHFIDIEGKEIPQVSVLRYDQMSKNLYIGDHNQLYALNSKGEFTSIWDLSSPAVDIRRTSDRRLSLLTIGHFKPSDLDLGVFSTSENPSSDKFISLISQLSRPVSSSLGDLDNDGKEDVIICSFGHHRGDLSWYSDFQKRHILSDLPGARIAIIRDLNKDKLPDIVVLMAQAWEGVDIYYNQTGGGFRKERALEFSPIHGLSYLQLDDFNGDGFQDMLVTNGDNWDYSRVSKPYHGIRIYLNDGDNHFDESWFYPMNGCSKAIARDFDGDGDPDIAAISFYDNIELPERSFVYLENSGKLNFTTRYMAEAVYGKWLTMDAGDFNQDGRLDVFLGSYFHNITEWSHLLAKEVTSFPEALFLKNIGEQNK